MNATSRGSRGEALGRGTFSRLTQGALCQHDAEMTAKLRRGMQVALRLYLRGCSLGDVTETRLVHRVPKQEGRSCGNWMWRTTYTAQHYRHVRTLPCAIQGQQHGHPYHRKVAMTTTFLHKTPAGTCRPKGKMYLSKDFIRL